MYRLRFPGALLSVGPCVVSFRTLYALKRAMRNTFKYTSHEHRTRGRDCFFDQWPRQSTYPCAHDTLGLRCHVLRKIESFTSQFCCDERLRHRAPSFDSAGGATELEIAGDVRIGNSRVSPSGEPPNKKENKSIYNGKVQEANGYLFQVSTSTPLADCASSKHRTDGVRLEITPRPVTPNADTTNSASMEGYILKSSQPVMIGVHKTLCVLSFSISMDHNLAVPLKAYFSRTTAFMASRNSWTLPAVSMKSSPVGYTCFRCLKDIRSVTDSKAATAS